MTNPIPFFPGWNRRCRSMNAITSPSFIKYNTHTHTYNFTKRDFQYVTPIIYGMTMKKYVVELDWKPREWHHSTSALPEDCQLRRRYTKYKFIRLDNAWNLFAPLFRLCPSDAKWKYPFEETIYKASFANALSRLNSSFGRWFSGRSV